MLVITQKHDGIVARATPYSFHIVSNRLTAQSDIVYIVAVKNRVGIKLY